MILHVNDFALGYKVAAMGRGVETAAPAKLGVSVYIDTQSTDATEALEKLGGAQAIPASAPSSKAMSELIDGLATNGKLIVIGVASGPIEVTPLPLIVGTKSIEGTVAGAPAGEEDTVNFTALTGVRPMIETYRLEKAGEAYASMMSGKACFRVVLTM
jgi:D-arabinose 1-dehydrogenase-like Zn-dependent alcohol dehydrogenase